MHACICCGYINCMFVLLLYSITHCMCSCKWWTGWQPASLNCLPPDDSPTFSFSKFLYLAADTHLQCSGSFAQASEIIRNSCQGQPFFTFNFLVLTLRIQFQGQGFSKAFPDVTTQDTSLPGKGQASSMMNWNYSKCLNAGESCPVSIQFTS